MALSGDPEDIYKTDARLIEIFPEDEALCNWIKNGKKGGSVSRFTIKNLLARLWAKRGLGLVLNKMVRNKELSAPIVIGRDHLDSWLSCISK